MKKRIFPILLILVMSAALIAWGYNGYIPGLDYKVIPPNTTDESSFSANYWTGIWVRPNSYIFPTALGGVAYVDLGLEYSEEQGYSVSHSYTFPDKICTHLRMLTGFVPGMSYPQALTAFGAPSSAWYGSGMEGDLIYTTVDGWKYEVPMSEGQCGAVMKITAPNGACFWFHGMPRLAALGIAAVLGIVLGVLLKIPNAIRKRKAASQPG